MRCCELSSEPTRSSGTKTSASSVELPLLGTQRSRLNCRDSYRLPGYFAGSPTALVVVHRCWRCRCDHHDTILQVFLAGLCGLCIGQGFLGNHMSPGCLMDMPPLGLRPNIHKISHCFQCFRRQSGNAKARTVCMSSSKFPDILTAPEE